MVFVSVVGLFVCFVVLFIIVFDYFFVVFFFGCGGVVYGLIWFVYDGVCVYLCKCWFVGYWGDFFWLEFGEVICYNFVFLILLCVGEIFVCGCGFGVGVVFRLLFFDFDGARYVFRIDDDVRVGDGVDGDVFVIIDVNRMNSYYWVGY